MDDFKPLEGGIGEDCLQQQRTNQLLIVSGVVSCLPFADSHLFDSIEMEVSVTHLLQRLTVHS